MLTWEQSRLRFLSRFYHQKWGRDEQVKTPRGGSTFPPGNEFTAQEKPLFQDHSHLNCFIYPEDRCLAWINFLNSLHREKCLHKMTCATQNCVKEMRSAFLVKGLASPHWGKGIQAPALRVCAWADDSSQSICKPRDLLFLHCKKQWLFLVTERCLVSINTYQPLRKGYCT